MDVFFGKVYDFIVPVKFSEYGNVATSPKVRAQVLTQGTKYSSPTTGGSVKSVIFCIIEKSPQRFLSIAKPISYFLTATVSIGVWMQNHLNSPSPKYAQWIYFQ